MGTTNNLNPVIPNEKIDITTESSSNPDQTRAHIAVEYTPITGKDQPPLDVYKLIAKHNDLNEFLAQAPRIAREADKDADAQLKANKPGFCSETKDQDLAMLGQVRLEEIAVTKAPEGWLSHPTFSILHPTLGGDIIAEAHGIDLGNIANIYEAEMKAKRDANCGPTHDTQQPNQQIQGQPTHRHQRPANLPENTHIPAGPSCIVIGDGANCSVINVSDNASLPLAGQSNKSRANSK